MIFRKITLIPCLHKLSLTGFGRRGIQDLSDFTGFPVRSALDYDWGMGMTEKAVS